MTPPINIDGTTENYSNVTIDGQDVEQITIDGQDVLSAIPDSLIADWTAENANNDTTVLYDERRDSKTAYDSTGVVGSPTYDSDGGDDGNGAYSFDGSDDGFDLPSGLFDGGSFSIAVRLRSSASSGNIITITGDVAGRFGFVSGPAIKFRLFDGSTFSETINYTTGSYIGAVAVYDEDDPSLSLFVENSSGSTPMDSAVASKNNANALAYRPTFADEFAAMDFSDGEVYNKALSSAEATNWIDTGSI